MPFWQDVTATSATGTVTSGSVSINVPGQVRTVLNATLQNLSGSAISNISIGTGNHILYFTGLSLADTSTLTISHGTDGLLRAHIGSTSVYSKISGADDLWADPGTTSVLVDADGSVKATIEAVGRYV